MKRFLFICVIIILTISMSGCINKNNMSSSKTTMEERKKHQKSSENLIKSYMEAIMQGDINKSNTLVTNEIKSKRTINNMPTTKLLGYKIKKVEKTGDNTIAEVDILEGEENTPYYSIINMSYRIGNNKGEMKINNIQEKNELTFSVDGIDGEKVFVIQEGRDVIASPVFKASQIPSYMILNSSEEPQYKVKVNKDNIGKLAVSSDGRHMVITSEDNGNTIIILAEKLLAVDNFTAEAENSGGAAGTEDIKEKKEKTKIDMDAIDYFENSSIECVSISPNGESMYTQIHSGDKMGFAIYSTYNKKLISSKVIEKFNSNEYTVLKAYYNDDNNLILSVRNTKKNIIENYSIDVMKDEAIKIS